jgi:hypothetical protein
LLGQFGPGAELSRPIGYQSFRERTQMLGILGPQGATVTQILHLTRPKRNQLQTTFLLV